MTLSFQSFCFGDFKTFVHPIVDVELICEIAILGAGCFKEFQNVTGQSFSFQGYSLQYFKVILNFE
jgi:hypothetical protein